MVERVSGKRHLITRVAGVSFYKSNVRFCAKSDPVTLTAEPDNPHDANAVVIQCNGNKIGYLPRDLAKELSTLVKDARVTATVSGVLGNESAGHHLGIELALVIDENELSLQSNAPRTKSKQSGTLDAIMKWMKKKL